MPEPLTVRAFAAWVAASYRDTALELSMTFEMGCTTCLPLVFLPVTSLFRNQLIYKKSIFISLPPGYLLVSSCLGILYFSLPPLLLFMTPRFPFFLLFFWFPFG
jgi:hypothetical protein